MDRYYLTRETPAGQFSHRLDATSNMTAGREINTPRIRELVEDVTRRGFDFTRTYDLENALCLDLTEVVIGDGDVDGRMMEAGARPELDLGGTLGPGWRIWRIPGNVRKREYQLADERGLWPETIWANTPQAALSVGEAMLAREHPTEHDPAWTEDDPLPRVAIWTFDPNNDPIRRDNVEVGANEVGAGRSEDMDIGTTF